MSCEYGSICSDLWPSVHYCVYLFLSVRSTDSTGFSCAVSYVCWCICCYQWLNWHKSEYLYLSVWFLVRVTFWFQGTFAWFSFLFSHPKRGKPFFFPIPLVERDRVPNPTVIVRGSRSSIPRREKSGALFSWCRSDHFLQCDVWFFRFLLSWFGTHVLAYRWVTS